MSMHGRPTGISRLEKTPGAKGAPLGSRIVVVGSVNVDLMLACPHLPLPGETVAGGELQVLPGGKGANQAVAAARLGGQVEFVGCVGDDAFGRQSIEALQAEGVGIAQLHTLPGVASGAAIVLVDSKGENSIAVSPGANALLSPDRVAQAAPLIAGAALVVAQLEVPLETVEGLAALAHQMSVPLILNPAPARLLSPALLQRVACLVPNEGEAALLAGRPIDSIEDACAVAQVLQRQGPALVLLTLGPRGLVKADASGVRHIPAEPVAMLDSTGAGDCFVGAFAAALAEGQAVDDAIALAQRAAAYSVQRRGAQAAMPRRQDLS